MFCTAKGKSPPKPPLLNGTINRPNTSSERHDRQSISCFHSLVTQSFVTDPRAPS
jgi:hypothetical protein